MLAFLKGKQLQLFSHVAAVALIVGMVKLGRDVNKPLAARGNFIVALSVTISSHLVEFFENSSNFNCLLRNG